MISQEAAIRRLDRYAEVGVLSPADLAHRARLARRRRAMAAVASVVFAAVGALIGVSISGAPSSRLGAYQCTRQEIPPIPPTASVELGAYACSALPNPAARTNATTVVGIATAPARSNGLPIARLAFVVAAISAVAVAITYLLNWAASVTRAPRRALLLRRWRRPWRAWWAEGVLTLVVYGLMVTIVVDAAWFFSSDAFDLEAGTITVTAAGGLPEVLGVGAFLTVWAALSGLGLGAVWLVGRTRRGRRARLRRWVEMRRWAAGVYAFGHTAMVAEAVTGNDVALALVEVRDELKASLEELRRTVEAQAASRPAPEGSPAGPVGVGSWRAWWRSRPRARRVS